MNRLETSSGTAHQSDDAIKQASLSVVIPTLNEAQELPETLRHAWAVPEVFEVIVVDAGSTDETRTIAARANCKVLTSEPSRGGQLRKGCSQATGNAIILLHADTWLPPNAGSALLKSLQVPKVVAGGFWKTFRERHILMLGSRFRCALRLHLFGRILGDQAMWVRRSALETIGGVPDMPLMEEFELCRRLRKIGRLMLSDATVVTSIRRFIERGIVRTYLRMWIVTAKYYLGSSPRSLRKSYERE